MLLVVPWSFQGYNPADCELRRSLCLLPIFFFRGSSRIVPSLHSLSQHRFHMVILSLLGATSEIFPFTQHKTSTAQRERKRRRRRRENHAPLHLRSLFDLVAADSRSAPHTSSLLQSSLKMICHSSVANQAKQNDKWGNNFEGCVRGELRGEGSPIPVKHAKHIIFSFASLILLLIKWLSISTPGKPNINWWCATLSSIE